jgi:hydroxyethylthiazole kinase-like uncharacterized protein yjeF
VVAGEMPGAAALTAAAAMRTGAGYVRLLAERPVAGLPHAIVQSQEPPASYFEDGRIGALVAGPGLGRTSRAVELLEVILAAPQPLVLDADALHLLGQSGPERLARLGRQPILTPHAGEFERMFGRLGGSKVDQARAAADRSQSIIVFKGADTVVAAPDGRAAIAPPATPWLASAGTGDVLAGIIAAMRARGLEPFEAACAGLWLHGRAASLAGPGLIADDLNITLPGALAECQ